MKSSYLRLAAIEPKTFYKIELKKWLEEKKKMKEEQLSRKQPQPKSWKKIKINKSSNMKWKFKI